METTQTAPSILYYCPICLRTLKQLVVSTYMVNRICGPHYTEAGEAFLTEMEVAGIQKRSPERLNENPHP